MPQWYFNWESGFLQTDTSHLWFAQINLHSWDYVTLDSCLGTRMSIFREQMYGPGGI